MTKVLATFGRHLGDLGRHFGSHGFQAWVQKSRFSAQSRHKMQENEVQEGVSEKLDLLMDF